jgi:hypothetical protein
MGDEPPEEYEPCPNVVDMIDHDESRKLKTSRSRVVNLILVGFHNS